MARPSKITYDPSISIEENAIACDVAVSTMRSYIQKHNIDRRNDATIQLILKCRGYLKSHPNATIREIHDNVDSGKYTYKKDEQGNLLKDKKGKPIRDKKVKYGISTIRHYWSQITRKEAIIFDAQEDKIITEFNEKSRRSTKKYALMSDLLKTAKDYLKLTEQDDVSRLRTWLMSNPTMPLVCIGNGGKHSSFPVLLYEMNKGVGKTITSLEFASMSKEAIKSSKVLLLTGSGHNIDITYAASRAKYNKENVACVSFHYDEKRSKAINSIKGKNKPVEESNCFVFEHKTEEGFIDIQSKFLTYGLFYRAFSNEEHFVDKLDLNDDLEKCYKYEINFEGKLSSIKNLKHLDILYGSYGEPVAREMESALVESGLCSASTTDYRNYCHGRFMLTSNSIPKATFTNESETAIVLLITPRERRIANQLRKEVFPASTPIITITTNKLSPLASIELLYKAFAFVAEYGEKYKGYNPNNPLNMSSIDKRIPKSDIEFVDDVKKFGALEFEEPDREILKKECAAKVNVVKMQEQANTEYLEQTHPIPVFPTAADLKKSKDEGTEHYDATKILTYAFRRKDDLRKGQWIPFGNMNQGFPFKIFGQHFHTSEAAYISGLFSDGSPKHIEIQQALIAEKNGYSAKKDIRQKNDGFKRKDWESFNVQWMLYVVWQKVKQNRKFRDLLMAVPNNAIIIEDSTYQTGTTSDFWGAKNDDRKEFSKDVELLLEAEDLDISIDEEDAGRDRIVNDVCNYGTYVGYNAMGKILTICRQCLENKTEPEIDYDLLKSKHIHMLAEEVNFDKQYRKPREKKEPVKVKPPIEVKVEEVKTKPKAKKASTKEKGIKQEFPLEGKMSHSVLGAIIGDISGSSREGHNTNRTDNKFFTGASTFTDDSVLTIALADWLNNKDTMPVVDALKYWGNRFPNAGYGSTFKSFLKPTKKKPFENTSTSNGAAMRVSPVALKAKSLDEALSLAEESAAPSHTGGGIKGAQAIAAATYIAKDGVALGKSADEIKDDIRSFVVERFNLNLNRTIEEIRELIMPLAAKDRENSKTKKGKEKTTFEEWKTCDAMLSAEMAITAVMLSNTYEEAIRLAISMGGDSDTIAALAGSIAAQMYGIPEALIKKALVFLPSEMIEVINKFEGNDFQPTGIKPPKISRWCKKDIVVYGAGPENEKNDEDGKYETIRGARMQAHPIPTIGKSLDEIQEGVKAFIEEAKKNPEKRYIVHKVGYNKAGYTLQQIAPMFKDAVGLKNVLLPEDMFNELTKRTE